MISYRTVALLIVTVAAASACAPREAPAVQKELELGPHRLQVSAPAGWDVLDQGAQKRFRKGEADIVLQNLGKVDWEPALASLQDDQRREVKSRRMRPVSREKNSSTGLPLTMMSPLPGFRNTRATALLRRPVP